MHSQQVRKNCCAAVLPSRASEISRVVQKIVCQGDLIGVLALFIELAAMKDPIVKEGVMAPGRPFVATLSLFCILVVMLLRPQWWVQKLVPQVASHEFYSGKRTSEVLYLFGCLTQRCLAACPSWVNRGGPGCGQAAHLPTAFPGKING